MRHAYLLMVHDQPQRLRRLIKALEAPDCEFFVHHDSAVEKGAFDNGVGGLGEVAFVPSGRARWGEFSMIVAELKLMHAAHARGFDYYTLLSGADYPIRSNSEIRAFLAGRQTEWIAYWRMEDRPSWRWKLRYHYPLRWMPMRDYQRSPTRRLFWTAYLRATNLFPPRTYPSSVVPYGGSQWWTLTHRAVGTILTFVERNQKFMRFYRTTHSPDEGLFQTILLNSPLSTNVALAAYYEQWREREKPWTFASAQEEKLRMIPDHRFNLRYIDWSGELTGARETPAVLDERDATAIRTSGCLFARKLESPRSDALLAQIDRWRAEGGG